MYTCQPAPRPVPPMGPVWWQLEEDAGAHTDITTQSAYYLLCIPSMGIRANVMAALDIT